MAQVKTFVQQQEETSYAVTTRAQMRQKASNQVMTAPTAEVTEKTEIEDKSTVPDTPTEIKDKTVMINQDNMADDDTGLDKLELSDQTIKEDYVSHVFPFNDDLFAHRATAT